MVATVNNRLLNILLADDGSDNMGPAIQLLANLPHTNDCVITSLRVLTPTEGSEYNRVESEAKKTENLLKNRHLQYQSKVVQGHPSDMLMSYAEETNPDLIVMGGNSVGKMDGLLGNVANHIVHTGHWPVLIVRNPFKSLKKVLLVTDGSSASNYTCEYLSAFPLPSDTAIEIMHVVSPIRVTYPVEPAGLTLPTISEEEELRLNQLNIRRGHEFLDKAKIIINKPNTTDVILKVGEPLDQILKHIQTEKIDMLVCGSRGTGNLTGWLMGSISRELVIKAMCPVLIVRTP